MRNELTGWVFNIQKFSLHDGPGIRDLVFLKGCPLRCQWCSNPESQAFHPEVLLKPDRCLGFETCGLCEKSCPFSAIAPNEVGYASIDRTVCDNCGQCARTCPSLALELVGGGMTVAEVVAEVEHDTGFHFRSGGGVTVSGGEPLAQAAFVASILKACQMRGIDTTVETSGYGNWAPMEAIGRHADLILYDLKCMDPQKHKAFTGVSNLRIKENLQRLADRFPDKPIIVRTPVIPGFNDTAEDIAAIATFAKGIATLEQYELLPFHKLGFSKYGYMGRSCSFTDIEPLPAEPMGVLRDLARHSG